MRARTAAGRHAGPGSGYRGKDPGLPIIRPHDSDPRTLSRHVRRHYGRSGRQAAARRAGHSELGRRGGACRRGRRSWHRRRRTPPCRLRSVRAGNHAGRDCEPHQAHPTRLGCDRAVVGRPDPSFSALLHDRCDLERPRRGHSRAGLLHRIVSAVRPRPEAVRGLFNEKLDLFAAVLKEQPVTWQGALRPPLKDQGVYPKTQSGHLATWIGVGGTPQSVMRAAHYGMPMMLAIIGGDPKRFVPFADLFRRALKEMGKPELPVGVHSHGYVAETDAQARDELFTDYKRMRDKIGAERGWPPMSRADFEREIEHGSLYVGSPETVARKIAGTIKI